MKFILYNPVDEKGGCVARAISKALNKNYNLVKDELVELASKLNKSDYRDEEVFNKYIIDNGFVTIEDYKEKIINELELDNGTYIIFCYKDDFYHMVTIKDNTIYDKSDIGLSLKVIKMYKKI